MENYDPGRFHISLLAGSGAAKGCSGEGVAGITSSRVGPGIFTNMCVYSRRFSVDNIV